MSDKKQLKDLRRDAQSALDRFYTQARIVCDDRGAVKAERDELQERLSENLAGEKLVLGLKAMGLSDEVQEWLGVFQLLAATGISLDALREVARGYSRGNTANRIPRVITAEELESGMQIAYSRGVAWYTCTVQRNNDGAGEGFKDPMWGREVFDEHDPIVLLADAPPQEPESVTAEDSSKRLTAADLDAAEVGSVLSGTTIFPERVKIESGRWEPRFSGATVLSSEFISLEGRTLTPPEKPARRGRVVKAGELREDDLIDLHWTRGGCNLDRYVSRAEGTLIYLQRDNPDALEEAVSNAVIAEIRLISRKPPTVVDSPITVRALHGEPIDTPNAAVVYKLGTQTEVSIAYQTWAVEDTIEGDDAVTDWTPLVPAGKEG